jgi:hypothetical protein
MGRQAPLNSGGAGALAGYWSLLKPCKAAFVSSLKLLPSDAELPLSGQEATQRHALLPAEAPGGIPRWGSSVEKNTPVLRRQDTVWVSGGVYRLLN